MATVRGMTPEAIRALLKREIGDYQALSIAVNSAKGASDSAVAEVENIRKDLENMDFDFDTSHLDKAMEKFETDMTELNQNLDALKDEALARENKLTALEKALNKDRSKFNQEMRDMAKELSDSKEKLQQDLSEVSEKLAQNVSEVGTNLSGELEKANKTLRESLDKDLKKLDNDLSSTFDNNLRSLERRHGQMINSLGDSLGAYQRNAESAVSGLASDIEKAKAYAEGFLQPGNLVWNPMALDDARGITPNNTNVTIESSPSGGKNGAGALKINRTSTGSSYIYYGQPQGLEFELRPGDVVAVSAWIKSTVEVPVETLGFHVSFGSRVVYNTTKIPANAWAYISGDIPYAQRAPKTVGFRVVIDKDFPANGSVIISDPHAKRKVTSDLIVDGAVTSQSLDTGAVTAGKIAADAVTANNILAGSIGAREIAAKSIGADQLAANSVTSEKIVSNAVNADKIKAKSIGTDHLVANAVTTEKLASKAVKADNIDANAVTAQKIASKAINGDHIQANSIDASKMTIVPGNLFPDPHFQDPTWGTSGTSYAHKNNGGEFRMFPNGKQVGTYYTPKDIGDGALMLEPGASYRITMNVYGGSQFPDDAQFIVYLRYRNSSGRYIPSQRVAIPATRGASVESAIFTAPDNASSSLYTIGFFAFFDGNGGTLSIWDVHMTRAADASLIVKGGVQADHIASKAITTDHMSANSIDGDRIKSNTLDADKIRAKSLTSDHVTFKDGFIKNAMIGDSQITNAKIKDLNAGKINAGTMHGDRIQSNTLNANRIKAGTLSAGQIATGTMSGDRIQSNTLDANRIKAGTLDAKQIATGTLNSDRIAANSITVKELRAGTIVPIGGSLIPSEPKESGGVPEPIWWEVCDHELAANFKGYPRPEGNPWRRCSTANSKPQTAAPPQRLVKIKPGQKYRLTFWCRSTKPDTTLYIEMRDQKGSHAVKSGAVYGSVNSGNYQTAKQAKADWPVTDFSESKTGSYLVANFTMPTSITKVTSTIEFKEDVEYVSLRNFYFNHSNGSNQGNQYLAGLSLELEIPDQQAIDARQDDAIERMDKDATFLNGVMLNIARMLVRAEQNKADSTLLTTNFEGTLLYGMLGIKTSSSGKVDLYISPEWKGRIEFIANCSVGAFNGTPATWFSKVTDDDFTTHTTSSVRVAPPTQFKHNGKFKYTRVDVRPRGEGVLDQLSVAIYHVPSYYEMFQLLTTKEITRVGMLEYGRSTSDPEPKLKEAPSWERRGSGLSSRR